MRFTLVQQKSKKQSKYFNKKTEYNGFTYDSQAEANYARRLDLLRNAIDPKERVIDIQRQVRKDITPSVENILTGEVVKPRKETYVVDFVVTYADGRVRFFDIKGFDKRTGKYRTTREFNRKKRLFEAKYGVVLEIVH
jgi:hypothetical protein